MSPSVVTGDPGVAPAYNTSVDGKSSKAPLPPYEIIEEPIHARQPIRVVCMGAGYSGILMGIIWNQRMQDRNADFAIYERNSDIGGTWLENRSDNLLPAPEHCTENLLDIPDANATSQLTTMHTRLSRMLNGRTTMQLLSRSTII